ncbi:MAG: hypothetical protein KF764_26195 [Labilithrix sp.]|nr:hypothetical protein [Labilithrix sp.]MBX3220919.1 hypothetical protein [Labilithrix sp.]
MSDERSIPEHLAPLLTSSIESVERLEILLHLRARRGKTFGARAVAEALRVSSVFAEQHLAILCGRGFLEVSIGSDLIYGYQPVSAALDAALQEIEELYRDRRADVVAVLKSPLARDPAEVFADAFLIRKPTKKKGV